MSLMNLTEDKPKCKSCEQLRATIAELVTDMVHISEYWNGDRNDSAMFDACEKVVDIANAAIAKAEGVGK
jgi:hypothetical protein